MKKIPWWVFFFAGWLLVDVLKPTDPTDGSRWNRSGLTWYRDNGTGCEYISVNGLFSVGDLKPRVDKDGKHICI